MTTALRILIVDDEPMIRFLLDKILTSEGHHVMTASDGEEAILLSKTHCFDIFLVDLIMPCKDGIETILTLRTRRRNTPIIAMSGGLNDGARSYLPLARKLGACGTLSKPFDKDTLMRAIRQEVPEPQALAV